MNTEKQILEICKMFKFWFHDLDHKDELILGLPYKGIYVFFSKYRDGVFNISMNNNTREGSPKHKSIVMPIRTLSDIILPMKFFSLDEVVEFIETLNK